MSERSVNVSVYLIRTFIFHVVAHRRSRMAAEEDDAHASERSTDRRGVIAKARCSRDNSHVANNAEGDYLHATTLNCKCPSSYVTPPQ